MVSIKAVWFGFIPLVSCCTVSQPGFTPLYEDLMEINSPRLYGREKREVPTNTNDYEFQAVLGLSELEVLELFLKNLSFPILINSTSQISSMDTTTVCSPNVTGYQCVCEENFAWSNNNCIAYRVCDVMLGDTCGCINDLPADGQFCQPNSSQIDAVDINVGIVVFIPTSSVSSSIFSSFRSTLQNISFPLTLSQSVGVKEMSFTTACDPNSANGLQCQCESGFAWPCDTCNSSNSCNNQTCTCLYGLPPNDEFCQPVSNATTCDLTPVPPTATSTPTINYSTPDNKVTNTTLSKGLKATVVAMEILIIQNETLKSSTPDPPVIHATTSILPNTTLNGTTLEPNQIVLSISETDPYTTVTNVTTAGIVNAPTLGITPNTSISNTTAPERSQNKTMGNATSPETTPSTTDAHTYSSETTLNSGFIDATSSGMNLSTRVTNKTTVDQRQNTTMGNTTSPETTPITTDAHTYSSETTLNSGFIDATSSEMNLSTRVTNKTTVDQRQNTTMGNTTSPETTPITTDAHTYSSETTLNSGFIDATSSGMNLSTRVTNKTTVDQRQNTAMGNTTSPETILDIATDVSTTQAAVKTTSNAATLEITTTIHPSSLGTMLNTTLVDATSPGMVNRTLKQFNGIFTINMDFDNSYNNPSSKVYADIYDAAERSCQRFLSKTCEVQSLTFRSGSTITYYTLAASSGDASQVKLAKDEMLKRLSELYPVEFVMEEVNTTTAFSGEEMRLTCGPPPEDLNFTVVTSVEWTHMGRVTGEGISLENRQSVLTLPSFFPVNDGIYVCKLKRGDNSTFKQSINAKAIPIPQIVVNPVKISVDCETPSPVPLDCSVNNGHTVTFLNTDVGAASHVTHEYTVKNCSIKEKIFTCESQNSSRFTKNITLMFNPSDNITCRDDTYGNGPIGFMAVLGCTQRKVGEKTAVCQPDGKYGQIQDKCVLEVVKNLLDQSEVLNELTLPLFVKQLSNVTVDFTDAIIDSPADIDAIVKILSNVANLSSSLGIKIEQDSMKNILETAGTLTVGEESWKTLNNNNNTRNIYEIKTGVKVKSASSSLLYSIERITSRLVNKSFSIETPHTRLNKSTFVNSFSGDLNSSVKIGIPNTDRQNHWITTIIFASMDNVLPARDKSNSSSKDINGKVALLWPDNKITNISLAFDVLDDRMINPECVFWDFNLFDGLGGWNDDGCMLVSHENRMTSCQCNHTTSFSILMSPNRTDHYILTYITYSGIASSIVSLIICLIIEGIIWKTIGDNMTSYFRHVSIVNIALSLLIANIWFVIGAAISDADKKNPLACTTATFFIHFFYLALFFWMLASALLLLYRTLSVFDRGLSKLTMLIIGFSLGYGAPLIITTITIAVTPSNHYTGEKNACWLTWDTHKPLLAFVIPALTIVAINIMILILVISKMLRRRVEVIGAQARERHALLVIIRCSAVLTPIFGVTWALGIGTMVSPDNFGLQVAFAVLNTLQGFCILMFGTLLDKRVTSELAKKFSCQRKTKTTGSESVTLGRFFWKLRRSSVSQKGHHSSFEGSCD
ncbi:adhesion G protein-coupled receptor F5-like [Poeciliopsis prolifica]|uniref:adhesion G protein-coupled receptor F5-like n=1 Tax=Poeciliopsis prolifica TaxID=188132 RepID=UPI002413C505|nr:adhesion G protein-coupled receptor F5-like [Poeciliopsis prolifica]